MKFILAFAVWTAIALVLGLSIYVMVVKGSPWLFIIAVLGFLVWVGKVGYSHGS